MARGYFWEEGRIDGNTVTIQTRAAPLFSGFRTLPERCQSTTGPLLGHCWVTAGSLLGFCWDYGAVRVSYGFVAIRILLECRDNMDTWIPPFLESKQLGGEGGGSACVNSFFAEDRVWTYTWEWAPLLC